MHASFSAAERHGRARWPLQVNCGLIGREPVRAIRQRCREAFDRFASSKNQAVDPVSRRLAAAALS